MLDTLRTDFARLPELLALDAPRRRVPEPEPEPVVPEPELAGVLAGPPPPQAPPEVEQLGLF